MPLQRMQERSRYSTICIWVSCGCRFEELPKHERDNLVTLCSLEMLLDLEQVDTDNQSGGKYHAPKKLKRYSMGIPLFQGSSLVFPPFTRINPIWEQFHH
ncbi:MAG: hypothetical protein ACTSUE_06035 [Promethearchaeota archaeon]